MNTIQSDTILTYLSNDEENFKELSIQFKKIQEFEEKLHFEYEQFQNMLKQLYEKEKSNIGKMGDLLKAVSEASALVNARRSQYQLFIQKKVIPSLNGQIEQIKQKKLLVQDYMAKKAFEGQKEEKLKQITNDEAKQKEVYGQLEQSRRDKNTAANTLITQFSIHINERNAETKAMFQHILNHLMVMCSTGLQEFSKVAHLIVEMDEKPDAEQFLSKMLGNQKNKKQQQ